MDKTTEPNVTYVDENGTEYHGAEAMRRGDQWIAGIDEHNRKVVRRMTPQGRRSFATYMRTGTLPTPAPRTSPRARGAGRPAVRGSSKRSSARSGDSGDEGPSDEPPPRRRQLCAHCGRDIPADRAAQARYCSDRHADLARQRQKRRRDRARAQMPRIPTTADFQKMLRLEPGELLRLLTDATCACNGHHIPDEDDVLGERCAKCGRQRPQSPCGRKLLHQLAALREAVVA